MASAAFEPLVVYEAASDEFADLHFGSAGKLLAESEEELFHEAGVWMPQTSEWLVTSNRLKPGTPETHVQISAVHFPTGKVRPLPHLEEKIVMANGGTCDFQRGAFLVSQGLGDVTGSIWRLDPTLSSATHIGPPEVLLLNSLNDVVVHRGSGTLLFTDPAYGFEAQGFRTTYNESKAVWGVGLLDSKYKDASSWVKLDDDECQPNGILLSPDEKTCYVSDVWHPEWHTDCTSCTTMLKHSEAGQVSRVMRFDVTGGSGEAVRLSNPTVFFDLLAEGAAGYPDGLKCDAHGNVYAGCGAGVRVYSPAGKYLGCFCVEGGVSNLCFGGPDGRTLLMLNETRAVTIDTKVCGTLACGCSSD
eukprot:gene18943-22635_t